MSIAVNSARRSFSLRKPAFLMVAFVAACLLCEFILLDRFQVAGRVVETQTGGPVAHAALLITLRGDRPYVPLPHFPRKNSVCIKTFVVEANAEGKFHLDELAPNSAFLNKEVTVAAFAPGWMSTTGRVDASSSLAGWPDEMVLRLSKPSSRKLAYHGQFDADPQMLRSVEFASLQQLLAGTMHCGVAGQPIFGEIVRKMSEIAKTREERRLTLAYCRKVLEHDDKAASACDETIFLKVDAVTPQAL